MIKRIVNVLVKGGNFGNKYSNNHVIGNKGYSVWKVIFKKTKKYSDFYDNYEIVDCVCVNITEPKKEIPARIKYITENEFNNILKENHIGGW
ncbi:MAG: hypothetical protein ACM3O3_13065 [Syntrophothermus sp.]